MEFITNPIEGLFVIEPRVFKDDRGYFFEGWREDEFHAHVGPVHFIQENESRSSRGVIRGLHYQLGEHAQAKLVHVTRGKVLDVALDIRPGSPTYGQYAVVELSDENHRYFYIPRGFAHGFLVVSDIAVFSYKVDNYYCPSSEAAIRWNDPAIGLDFGSHVEDIITSPKDAAAPLFRDAVIG